MIEAQSFTVDTTSESDVDSEVREDEKWIAVEGKERGRKRMRNNESELGRTTVRSTSSERSDVRTVLQKKAKLLQSAINKDLRK